MITTVLAYVSLDTDVQAIQHREAAIRHRLIKNQDPESFTEEQENQQTAADKNADKLSGTATTLTRWALGFAIAAMVAFIVGAGVAGVVLSSQPS